MRSGEKDFKGDADPRRDLRRIARAALDSADPARAVARTLRLEGDTLHVQGPDFHRAFDLAALHRILVLGFGKAAGPMARAVEEVLGSRIERGLIVVKPGHEVPLRIIRQVPGGHPVPDETSLEAAAQVAALAEEADARTLVITLVSGGGSSLVAAPARQGTTEPTLADLQETTRQLLACGAAIEEINCIRKHLLRLAGGRLARLIAPAVSVSLVLSDVVGDDLQSIASGPMTPDSTTFQDALAVVRRYGLGSSLPSAVVTVLEDGARGRIAETPKPAAAELSEVSNVLVGTNLLALRAAADQAEHLGYHPLIFTSRLSGEAREAARVLAAAARDAAATGQPCPRPACLLAGGETTVTVKGAGTGGRNQEMALAFLREIQKDPAHLSGAWLLAFSTDGEDGPTDAAGGFADASLLEASRRSGLGIEEALLKNDSHTFLRAIGGLFVTGPTNTNVCDIQVILVP